MTYESLMFALDLYTTYVYAYELLEMCYAYQTMQMYITNTSYYDTGMEAYQNESYEDAIEYLSRAFSYDNTNGEALYNLGNAYRKSGDDANAIATYTQVIELFPNTEKANRSQSYINEMTAETE